MVCFVGNRHCNLPPHGNSWRQRCRVVICPLSCFSQQIEVLSAYCLKAPHKSTSPEYFWAFSTIKNIIDWISNALYESMIASSNSIIRIVNNNSNNCQANRLRKYSKDATQQAQTESMLLAPLSGYRYTVHV